MIRHIRATPTLSEPVRQQALAFATDYREAPDKLNQACWSVVSRPWARPGAYALALRQAEAACRQEPGNDQMQTFLGAAQYRNKQYGVAAKSLTMSDERRDARWAHYNYLINFPADLAFLAMAQFQLGQKAEAAATLGRLREEMKKLPFFVQDAELLLQEVEGLVDPKK
jgi:tetratricopeptide (TPR) repeat protein